MESKDDIIAELRASVKKQAKQIAAHQEAKATADLQSNFSTPKFMNGYKSIIVSVHAFA